MAVVLNKSFRTGGNNQDFSSADFTVIGNPFTHVDGATDYLVAKNVEQGELAILRRTAGSSALVSAEVQMLGGSTSYTSAGVGSFNASGAGYWARFVSDGVVKITKVVAYNNYSGFIAQANIGPMSASTKFRLDHDTATGTITLYKDGAELVSTQDSTYKTGMREGYAQQAVSYSPNRGLFDFRALEEAVVVVDPEPEITSKTIQLKASTSTNIETDTRTWPTATIFAPGDRCKILRNVAVSNGTLTLNNTRYAEIDTFALGTDLSILFEDGDTHAFVPTVKVSDAAGNSPVNAGGYQLNYEPTTVTQIGGRGDNWQVTILSDGRSAIQMCDGDWALQEGSTYSNTMYYRTAAAPKAFDFGTHISHASTYPLFPVKDAGIFTHSHIAVGNDIWAFASQCDGIHWNQYYALKLLHSPDNGATWFRVKADGTEAEITRGVNDALAKSRAQSEYFIFRGTGVTKTSAGQTDTYYRFVQIAVLQDGAAYAHGLEGAGTKYLYLYSPDPNHASKVNMARVPVTSVGNRSTWQFFVRYDAGVPVWSSDIDACGVVYSIPDTDANGKPIRWYSGLPDAVYNAGIGKYIMVNGAMYYSADGSYNSDKAASYTGSATFYIADNPWGPWIQIRHIDHLGPRPNDSVELLYQPKLDQANISPDGLTMNFIWSDHAGGFDVKYYTWNQMDITLTPL